VPLPAQPAPELAGQRRLARALQAGQHDHRRRRLRHPHPAGLTAEDPDELLVDDLDDLLGRVERLRDLGPARPLLDRGHEVLDHREGDVGLEQGDADLPRRRVDVGVGEPTLAAQVLEGLGEAVLKRREHGSVCPRRRDGRTVSARVVFAIRRGVVASAGGSGSGNQHEECHGSA
jgi:hypothetical protein